jgi:NAD(P) transhydrogenase subunit beta
MPILDVDKAQNVVVIKRSMNPGFAGIDNPLYRDPKTVMLFAGCERCGRGARVRRKGALTV